VRVADSDGRSTAWKLIRGIAYSVNCGCEVINISLGSTTAITALTDVMDWCDEKNVLVVAAIGNNAHEGACFPARISKSICVSGLNPDNTKAPFSNWDGTADASGPATGIISASSDGMCAVWSGTSFSTPMVAAAIADCLRRTTHIRNRLWSDFLKKSGSSIDTANPLYKSKLGNLLNIPSLNAAVLNSAP